MLAQVWMKTRDMVAALHRRLRPWSGVVKRIGRSAGATGAAMLLAVAATAAAAPPDSPLVTMAVTLPSGEVKTIAAHDSETATFTLPDGATYGVRPTIMDSKPWTRTVVTFFKMPTASTTTEEVGAVEVKTGGSATAIKGTPAFKVAVSTVSLDARSATSS